MHATDTSERPATSVVALRQIAPASSGADVPVRLEDRNTTIGAGPTCSLRINVAGVRPLHCVIARDSQGYTIRRWTNDTLLNGQVFTESPLSVGDRLQLGPVEFEVVAVQADDAPSAVPPAEPQGSSQPVTPVWIQLPRRPSLPEGKTSAASNSPQPPKPGRESALAEKCKALENELLETRSLLTSLGEELLQARENASQHISQLTNRIDELEGNLQERDNLLALLQEALQETTLSAAYPRDAGDTDSPTDEEPTGQTPAGISETDTVWGQEQWTNHDTTPEEKPSANQEDSTPAGLWGEASESPSSCDSTAQPTDFNSPFVTEFGGDEAPGTPQADQEASGWVETDAPSNEEEAPAASESPFVEVAFDSPAPLAPPQAPEASVADLWDVEKPSAEGASSLWDPPPEVPTSSPEAAEQFADTTPSDASPFGSAAAEWSVQLENTGVSGPEEPIAAPAVKPNDESNDMWGSGSLWQVDAETSHADPQPEPESSAAEASLWGFSPSSEVPVPEPTIEPTPALPVSERTNESVSSEPVVTKKAPAPVSFIEQYRHLLEDEDDAPADVAPPASTIEYKTVEHQPAEQTSSTPACDGGDDDSIEAYMAKMMQRLRGESVADNPIPQPAEPMPVESPSSLEVSQQPARPPLLSLEELKTAAAPERHHNMTALRDLANSSARHAIGMANSRRALQKARANLALSTVAMVTAGFLVWLSPGLLSPQLAGGIVGMASAGLWAYRSLGFLQRAREESRNGAELNPAEETLRPEDLPIDLPASSSATSDAADESGQSPA
jgi:pSer/pThr/pTyr-binding forkhead associated (FHA) protein